MSGPIKIQQVDEKDTCTTIDLLLTTENESKASMFDLFNTVKFFTRQDMNADASVSNSFKGQKLCFTFDSKKIHTQFVDKLKETLIKDFVDYEKSRQI